SGGSGGLWVGAGIVPPASVLFTGNACSAPDDHFASDPHRGVTLSGRGRVCLGGSCPIVGARIVCSASVQIQANIFSAPDDHFTAGPYCRVHQSGDRRSVG